MSRGAGDLSIGEVAEATGLSVHALRFFEREDLFLRPIPRSGSGQRVYEPSDVEWLLLCNRFRASGMPIAMLKEFARFVWLGPGNEAERLELLREHEQAVRAKVADLNADLEVIHGKVVAYEKHVRDGTAGGVWAPTPSR
ncbi:MerR family transcriptional regulator [Streptomyces sp. NPDC056323]|uniref:MerR family transcriptional regulator n=1 Tax=unclassified Streptomyces TaxID=2593676 RepID=UPI0035D8E1F0